MKDNKDFSYYTYEVGRYLPSFTDDKKTFKPYKPDNSKLVWNVIYDDFNTGIVPVNIFEINWVFLERGLLYAKKHYNNDFIKFADHIRHYLQYQFWSKCEHEIIVCGWPASTNLKQKDLDELQEELNKEKKYYKEKGYDWEPSVDVGYPRPCEKIDVYTQVMLNWDNFINYVWNNRHLITKKKLGLER